MREFGLEAFEPRLLLSGDGMGAATLDLQPPEDTASNLTIVENQEESASILEQESEASDLFSELPGEAIENTTSQGRIARQGVAPQNSLPDLTVSNVVINSSDWAHSFRVQFTLTNSGSATVNLTVTPVNDEPTIQAPTSLSTAKQTAKVITGIAITDVDAASGNLTLTLSVARGTLSLADDVATGLVANQITGNGTALVSVTAPLATINATLADSGGLTYTGLLNLIGADTLQLNVNDNSNTGSGGAKSGSASIVIDVTGSAQDAWRNQHFDVATLTDPAKETTHWGDAADPDMDTQNNGYEYVADTDPNSAASKFQFQVAKGVSGIDLIFSPISGARTYTVEFIDQIGQAYGPATNGTTADEGNTRTLTVQTDVSQRFYRVRISVGN